MLLAWGGQLQARRSYKLNTHLNNHAMRSKLEHALQVKDTNAARKDMAGLLLTAVRRLQDESAGSAALLLKSELPPVADSPATRAAYAELFYTVYSRVAKLARTASFRAAGVALALRIIWVQAADCGKLAAAALSLDYDSGYEYAMSQLHVRSAASSPAMAALLLGPSPLPERCLRWVLHLWLAEPVLHLMKLQGRTRACF